MTRDSARPGNVSVKASTGEGVRERAAVWKVRCSVKLTEDGRRGSVRECEA